MIKILLLVLVVLSSCAMVPSNGGDSPYGSTIRSDRPYPRRNHYVRPYRRAN